MEKQPLDTFARESAKHAHTRVAELTERVARLEKLLTRRTVVRARCHLCGDPCRKGSRFCHAHAWAEGDG